VFFVFQIEQRPLLRVGFQDDMSATTAVAAVGAAFGRGWAAIKVDASGTAFARAKKDFDVINEVFHINLVISSLNHSSLRHYSHEQILTMVLMTIDDAMTINDDCEAANVRLRPAFGRIGERS